MHESSFSGAGKSPFAQKEAVKEMFDDIAHSYDFLNSFLSLGIHKHWKRMVKQALKKSGAQNILDVACGTGDLAILAATLKPQSVVAIDISPKMLEVGRQKAKKKKNCCPLDFIEADASEIPFNDGHFDAVTIGFGVRNFEIPALGLKEIHRVLKPQGKIFILEFTTPRKGLKAGIYRWYFKRVLPFVGKIISGNKTAYTYLPDSVTQFPQEEDFCKMLSACGFHQASFTSLNGGIAAFYSAEK